MSVALVGLSDGQAVIHEVEGRLGMPSMTGEKRKETPLYLVILAMGLIVWDICGVLRCCTGPLLGWGVCLWMDT